LLVTRWNGTSLKKPTCDEQWIGAIPFDESISLRIPWGERPKRTSKRLFNGDYRCWQYHQAFKTHFVAGWGTGDDDSWQISGDEIAAWLETQPAYEPLDQHGRTVISFQDVF
jgi:hypothetical protein